MLCNSNPLPSHALRFGSKWTVIYSAYQSRAFRWGTEREMIWKPIWHIYVDRLFKGITALSINMFVYWNGIVFGFTSSCLITLCLWKTGLLHMVMSKKKKKNSRYRGWNVLVLCSHLTLPWRSPFHFTSRHWNLALSAKQGCVLCEVSPSGSKLVLKKKSKE